MKILGVELDFDFCDADQAEAYEREVRRVVDRVQDKKQYEGKSNADGIRIQCRIVDEFFDAVFGSGTADMLFHGKSNLREHLEAFGAVSDAARESTAELRALSGRYAPNRAARRQEQKQQEKMERQQKRQAGQRDMAALQYGGDGVLPGVAPAPSHDSGVNVGQMPTQEQIDVIKKFADMMPEMDAFMRSYKSRQGNGVNG